MRIRTIRPMLLVGVLVAWALPVRAAPDTLTVVKGRVADGRGAPLPFANVQLVGTTEGAAADAGGRFRFRTRRRGERVLQATMIGFVPARQRIALGVRDTVTVRLVLKEQIVQLDEAIVSTSTFTTGLGDDVTLGMLDVVSTAGSAADIYRALQTFPGVTSIGDAAGLFVRGGDLSETVTLLDNAPVAHPYRYETPTTAMFGTLSPFLVQGTAFSSGGFSARYGNALSGVLAMKSLGYPEQTHLYTNLSLAATSLGVDWPLTEDLGLRFSGNRSFTKLLFRLNGQTNEFSLTPRSTDANLSLLYDYAEDGRIKFFNYGSTYRVGVRVDEPAFSGFYRGSTDNRLHNLYWTDAFGAWTLEANASLNRYDTHRTFGALDLRIGDDLYQLRFDAERAVNGRVRLRIGGQTVRAVNTLSGTVPAGDVNSNTGKIRLDERFDATRWAGYVEAEVHPSRRVLARAGVRTAYHTLARETIFDPRVAVQYFLNTRTDLRGAWGIYHQFPEPHKYNTVTGNPALSAQRAQHFIFGIEHEREQLLARLEAYYKPYADLVLVAPEQNFTNDGEGMARGVDLFLKYGGFLQTPVYGRLAYSFLQARRLQPRRFGREVVYEKGPAPFDVTHNLALVVNTTFPRPVAGGYLGGGFTFRYATGRPHTPVRGTVPAERGAFYLPIEGPVGTERLPAYRRLDLQISYYLPFGEGDNIIFYVSASNVFDRANVRRYEYSADYSERHVQRTSFNRSYYFGATFNYTL